MAAAILLLFLALAQATLHLDDTASFKVVQFTDMLFGKDDDADAATQDAMRTVLSVESPDLVVVTGNVVDGTSWDGSVSDWFADQYAKMTEVL